MPFFSRNPQIHKYSPPPPPPPLYLGDTNG